MTNNRRTSAAGRRRTSYKGAAWIEGSVARNIDVKRQLEKPKRQLSHTTRKNRDKAHYMSFAYVLFLATALALTAFVLIGYIRLESSITSSVKEIARMESDLNSLRLKNDEQLSRIENAMNLEEIKRIAITELGMGYAGEGQIVSIPDGGSDYVRQYGEVHK